MGFEKVLDGGFVPGESVLFLCESGRGFAGEERRWHDTRVFQISGGAGAEDVQILNDLCILGWELGVGEELLKIGGDEAVFVEEEEDQEAETVGWCYAFFV